MVPGAIEKGVAGAGVRALESERVGVVSNKGCVELLWAPAVAVSNNTIATKKQVCRIAYIPQRPHSLVRATII